MATDRYMTISDIPRELRYSPETIRRKVVSGVIPGGIQSGQRCEWRIPSTGYREYLSKSRRDTSTEQTTE